MLIDRIGHRLPVTAFHSRTVRTSGPSAAQWVSTRHLVYISIVGVDVIDLSYYRHKLESEKAIESSAVPSTILRATQFFELLDQIFGLISRSIRQTRLSYGLSWP